MDLMVNMTYGQVKDGKWEKKITTLKIPVAPQTHFRRMVDHLGMALSELRKMIWEYHSPCHKPGIQK